MTLTLVDEEQVQRLDQQRIALDEQRTQLEAEIQRLSQAAKASKPEQEKLAKLEVRCDESRTVSRIAESFCSPSAGRPSRTQKSHLEGSPQV